MEETKFNREPWRKWFLGVGLALGNEPLGEHLFLSANIPPLGVVVI
jgi:hypothetical protein